MVSYDGQCRSKVKGPVPEWVNFGAFFWVDWDEPNPTKYRVYLAADLVWDGVELGPDYRWRTAEAAASWGREATIRICDFITGFLHDWGWSWVGREDPSWIFDPLLQSLISSEFYDEPTLRGTLA